MAAVSVQLQRLMEQLFKQFRLILPQYPQAAQGVHIADLPCFHLEMQKAAVQAAPEEISSPELSFQQFHRFAHSRVEGAADRREV